MALALPGLGYKAQSEPLMWRWYQAQSEISRLDLSHPLDTEPGFRVTVRRGGLGCARARPPQGRVLSAAQAASLSVPDWVVREAFRVAATRM